MNQFQLHTRMSTEQLTEVYTAWLEANPNAHQGCAFDSLHAYHDRLTVEQMEWLDRFLNFWRFAQYREDMKAQGLLP